ncbi:MAG TPA: OsmC family protein [Anaerolineales bacterium]|nr:OsmC family protein [Anaerolineales bacterium]
MKFSARIQNSSQDHQVVLTIGDREQSLSIAPKPAGGSSVSGGELLFLALATCYCNDVYREAAKRDTAVESVEVEVDGDFEAEGKPASNIVYRARIKANASQAEICELIEHTDTVAEIQNTVRAGIPVVVEMK